MILHDEIINLQVEKRKQNLAIDEALKSHKNLRDIMVAIYTRGHLDARHAAAEKAAEQRRVPDPVEQKCYACFGECERLYNDGLMHKCRVCNGTGIIRLIGEGVQRTLFPACEGCEYNPCDMENNLDYCPAPERR